MSVREILYNDGEYSAVAKDGKVILTHYGYMVNDFESKESTATIAQSKFLIKTYGKKAILQMWKVAKK